MSTNETVLLTKEEGVNFFVAMLSHLLIDSRGRKSFDETLKCICPFSICFCDSYFIIGQVRNISTQIDICVFIEVITNVPLKKSKAIIRSDICRFCMVGDRPVDLVSFSQEYHYVPNCTAEGLEPLFCTVLNDSSTQCEPYFSRMAHIQNWRGGGPAIRQEVRIVMCIVEVKRISHLIEMGFYYGIHS